MIFLVQIVDLMDEWIDDQFLNHVAIKEVIDIVDLIVELIQ